MKNARVVLLNATSAIVTYEIRYKTALPDGQNLEIAPPKGDNGLGHARWQAVVGALRGQALDPNRYFSPAPRSPVTRRGMDAANRVSDAAGWSRGRRLDSGAGR